MTYLLSQEKQLLYVQETVFLLAVLNESDEQGAMYPALWGFGKSNNTNETGFV